MAKKDVEFIDKRNQELFGEEYVRILINEIKKAGKNASGKLIKSVDYRLEEKADVIATLLESEEYLTFVDEGRKAGSYPPINAIARWANLKGISKSAVFPIARKIYKFGIKPTNILDKTIKTIETSTKLTRQMEDAVGDNIADYIAEEMLNYKNVK